jgi:cell division protein FtsX
MRSQLLATALVACLLSVGLFAGNVLYGRFAPVFGWDPGLRLARVPEFLLLFASAVFFVIAALAAERRAGDSTRSLINSGEIE